MTGLNESTVRVHLFRAIRRLRALLAPGAPQALRQAEGGQPCGSLMRCFVRDIFPKQALVEAVMTGERPAHLDRCDLCADRAVELGRWLDDVRARRTRSRRRGVPARSGSPRSRRRSCASSNSSTSPSRVIAFPGPPRSEPRDAGGRRVAPAWVGVAAAAGLVLGVVGGQVTARTGRPDRAAGVGRRQPTPTPSRPASRAQPTSTSTPLLRHGSRARAESWTLEHAWAEIDAAGSWPRTSAADAPNRLQ